VNHSVVVGIPKVLETARGTAGHAPVITVAGEVGLLQHYYGEWVQ